MLEDGQRRLVRALERRMDRAEPGPGPVRAWIEGVLEQARNPEAAENTRPFALNGPRLAERYPDAIATQRERVVAPLRDAVAALGADPRRDADAIYELTMGQTQDAIARRVTPSGGDVAHTVAFAAAGHRGGSVVTEREVLLTGIGGQGVQLAAQVLARAAVLEGRDVLLFGVYGGAMRGMNTDGTVVVGDGPIQSPPLLSSTWSAIAMHDRFWAPSRAESPRRRCGPGQRQHVHRRAR